MPSKPKERTRYVTLKGFESEKHALQRELLSWGLDTQNNAEHLRFAARVTAEVQACQKVVVVLPNRNSHQPEEVRSTTIDLPVPENVEEAVRFIFRDNVTTCPKVLQLVDDKFSSPNCADEQDRCCSVFSTNTKNVVKVQIRWEFDRFSFGALDPLQRFVYLEDLRGKERFRSKLTNLTLSDEIKGMVYEAIVAQHASHREACYHCKARKSLKWSGGGNNPWTDMICIVCDSAYEIKSKRNMEAVEKAGEIQTHFGVNGGSYRGYYELHNDPSRKAGWKHFIVLVSRSTSDRYDIRTKTHRLIWQVQIGEIRAVEPQLTRSSFLHWRDPKMNLKSVIRLKNKPKAWFNIPSFQHFDYVELYTSVLAEFYPNLVAEMLKPTKQPSETVHNHHHYNSHVSAMTTSATATSSQTTNHGNDNNNNLPQLFLDDVSVDDWIDEPVCVCCVHYRYNLDWHLKYACIPVNKNAVDNSQ